MSRRRFIPLAVGVVVLLAVVAVAALGRPLGKGSGNGGGLPLTFWDYVFTTLLILFLLMIIASFAALFFLRREREELKPYQSRTARALVILLVVSALIFVIGRHIDLNHLFHPNSSTTTSTGAFPGVQGGGGKAPRRSAHLQWPEIVVVFGVLLAVAAVYLTRSRGNRTLRRRGAAPPELMVALDESLDDLRGDPDLRRAIIAAYARMEKALAAAGVPRQPHEAPLEYLERALLSLDTSAKAVRRLTDLFEWARFSHHEPEPPMRDEAVDALVAVRDELRAQEPVETW